MIRQAGRSVTARIAVVGTPRGDWPILSARVPPDVAEGVRRRAAQAGVPVSDVIRDALADLPPRVTSWQEPS